MSERIKAIAELMFGPDPTPGQVREAKLRALAYLYGGSRPPSDVDVIEGECTERSKHDAIPNQQIMSLSDGRPDTQD